MTVAAAIVIRGREEDRTATGGAFLRAPTEGAASFGTTGRNRRLRRVLVLEGQPQLGPEYDLAAVLDDTFARLAVVRRRYDPDGHIGSAMADRLFGA